MRHRPLLSFCLLMTGIFCLITILRGEYWLPERNQTALENQIPEGTDIILSGTIRKTVQKTASKAIYLSDVSISLASDSGRNEETYHAKGFLVYVDPEAVYHIGNVIAASGSISYFSLPRNPGNFDQKFYYAKQQIEGYLFPENVTVTDNRISILGDNLRILRERWSRQLTASVGSENGGILSAMLLGEKRGMDTDLKELYQLNGIGHVLAVSGVHLSIIGIGIYQFFRRTTGSYPLGGTMGILFMVLYMIMIGATVSAARAFIMFLFRVGADIVGRNYDAPTALGASAFLLLLRNPLYLYDGSFWFSYGAILSIMIVLPAFGNIYQGLQKKYDLKFLLMEKDMKKEKRRKLILQQLRMNIMESFFASLSIQLFLLPVQLYFYFEVAPYSVLLNLIVIPLMSLIMLSGVIGSLFVCILPVAAAPFFAASSRILDLYRFLGEETLKIPGSRLVIGKPELWQVGVYFLGVTGLLIVVYRWKDSQIVLKKKEEEKERLQNQEEESVSLTLLKITVKTDDSSQSSKQLLSNLKDSKKNKKRILLLAAGGYLLFLFLLVFRFGDYRTGRMTLIDVGQGDCIFLKSPSGVKILVDGGSSSEKQVGKYRIESYLESLGVGSLDYVFVTHGDLDHMNGIQEMMERQRQGVKIRALVLPVKTVWDEKLQGLAVLAKEKEIPLYTVDAGQNLQDKSMKISCLYPSSKDKTEPGNSASLVLKVSLGGKNILLTGDLEGEGEDRVIKILKEQESRGSQIRWDILKVAHHGSRYSTSEKFLQTVDPKYAVISAGEKNRYGHPHRETLERLKKAGVKVITTKENGAVEMLL